MANQRVERTSRPRRARRPLTRNVGGDMEPMTVATTMATLVGLICNYRQEVGARSDTTHREFMEWLSNHRHNELRNLIAQTYHLQTEIDSLLRADHAQILEGVDRANRVLLDVLGRLDEFKCFVQNSGVQRLVSDQAVDILRQVFDSGYGGVAIVRTTSEPLVRQTRDSAIVCFRYGQYGPSINLNEPLFAEDDIRTLASLGFLNLETSGNGLMWFKITRAGGEFLGSVNRN